MTELWELLRDRRVSTAVVLGACVLVGFAVVALAYQSAARVAITAAQMPFAVSGGLAGLAVIGAALGLLSIHVDRVEAAEERRQLAALRREALLLARQGGKQGAGADG